jgi:hypothetical protein
MAKVEITVAGHQIVVEADATLDELADKALHLFRETSGVAKQAIGFGTNGSTTERSEQTQFTDTENAVMGVRA